MDTSNFPVNERLLNLTHQIVHLLGKYEGLMGPKPQPKLRRTSRVRSIQGSLAIEGNTLNLDQVTALLEGKRVLGPKKDILEIQNANLAYERIPLFNPFLISSLLKAHEIMMNGLISDAGKFRTGNIGIWKQGRVSHVAPKPQFVQGLVKELLKKIKTSRMPPLITSCVFHHEFELIHPFSDGNGRLGRLWQHLLLIRFHPLFEFVPVESVIRSRQRQYYAALETSDGSKDSAAFCEFMLSAILEGTIEFMEALRPNRVTAPDRLSAAREHFKRQTFSRGEYISFFVKLSSATASRDLKSGVDSKLLEKRGDKALTRYQFRNR